MELKLLVMKVVRKSVGSTHRSDCCWLDDCSKTSKIHLVDVFRHSVEHLLNLNYLLGLLNRQNSKHELFAFTCNCRTLLLQCIVYQWIGPSSIHSYR